MLEKQRSDEKDLPQSCHILWLHHHQGRCRSWSDDAPWGSQPPSPVPFVRTQCCSLLVLLWASSRESFTRGHNTPGNKHTKGIVDTVSIRLTSPDEPQLLQRKEGSFGMVQGWIQSGSSKSGKPWEWGRRRVPLNFANWWCPLGVHLAAPWSEKPWSYYHLFGFLTSNC